MNRLYPSQKGKTPKMIQKSQGCHFWPRGKAASSLASEGWAPAQSQVGEALLESFGVAPRGPKGTGPLHRAMGVTLPHYWTFRAEHQTEKDHCHGRF